MNTMKIGTCSWNYDSWVGLVYPHKCHTASEYLAEYAKKFRTVEIDSWFYRIPSLKDVLDYKNAVDEEFSFTCKTPQIITLTRERKKGNPVNKSFLSVDLFMSFYERIAPLKRQVEAIELEFEYLNKGKMNGLQQYIKYLDDFVSSVPRDIPIAIECRNPNYLNDEYFSFLKSKKLMHVFSEKQYMPSIVSVYDKHGEYLDDTVIIRLLGGDRKEMERLTDNKWNSIVLEKPEKANIIKIVMDMLVKGKKAMVYVNNHYEGSAPLTINSILGLLSG